MTKNRKVMSSEVIAMVIAFVLLLASGVYIQYVFDSTTGIVRIEKGPSGYEIIRGKLPTPPKE